MDMQCGKVSCLHSAHLFKNGGQPTYAAVGTNSSSEPEDRAVVRSADRRIDWQGFETQDLVALDVTVAVSTKKKMPFVADES